MTKQGKAEEGGAEGRLRGGCRFYGENRQSSTDCCACLERTVNSQMRVVFHIAGVIF